MHSIQLYMLQCFEDPHNWAEIKQLQDKARVGHPSYPDDTADEVGSHCNWLATKPGFEGVVISVVDVCVEFANYVDGQPWASSSSPTLGEVVGHIRHVHPSLCYNITAIV